MESPLKPPLIVLLGASEFPKHPRLKAAQAFKRSHAEIKAYALSPLGLGVPSDQLLDLFDHEGDATDIARELDGWLKKNAERSQDLVVYYVGHGGFVGGTGEYFLALRDTSIEDADYTGLALRRLANILKRTCKERRRFVIIDACFAGAAAYNFQTDLNDIVRKKVENVDWEPKDEEAEVNSTACRWGTTLLCSSSREDPSLFDANDKTYFATALLEVLRAEGGKDEAVPIDCRKLAARVARQLSRKYGDEAAKPEIHSPDQRDGDIAGVPVFAPYFSTKPKPKVVPTPTPITTVVPPGAGSVWSRALVGPEKPPPVHWGIPLAGGVVLAALIGTVIFRSMQAPVKTSGPENPGLVTGSGGRGNPTSGSPSTASSTTSTGSSAGTEIEDPHPPIVGPIPRGKSTLETKEIIEADVAFAVNYLNRAFTTKETEKRRWVKGSDEPKLGTLGNTFQAPTLARYYPDLTYRAVAYRWVYNYLSGLSNAKMAASVRLSLVDVLALGIKHKRGEADNNDLTILAPRYGDAITGAWVTRRIPDERDSKQLRSFADPASSNNTFMQRESIEGADDWVSKDSYSTNEGILNRAFYEFVRDNPDRIPTAVLTWKMAASSLAQAVKQRGAGSLTNPRTDFSEFAQMTLKHATGSERPRWQAAWKSVGVVPSPYSD